MLNLDKRFLSGYAKLALSKAGSLTTLFVVTIGILSNQKAASAAFPFNGILYPGQNVCVRIDNTQTDFALNFNRANYNWTTKPYLSNQAVPQPNWAKDNSLGYVVASSFYTGYWLSWNQRPKYVNIVNQTSNTKFSGAVWSSGGNAVNPGACYTKDGRVIYNYLIRS